MDVAALAEQVPQVDALEPGADGWLRRTGTELEMNPYCRRAVSQGVALVSQFGGRCVVITLGLPSAEDVLREVVAWGADEGVRVTDPVFASSDTLATARAFGAALRVLGPFGLVMLGRNSVDADTGQVGPQIAELLDPPPFAASARQMEVGEGSLTLACEVDGGHKELRLALTAAVSVPERLSQPAKVPPQQRAAVPAARLRRLAASDLGPGPWGAAASPMALGATHILDVGRHHMRHLGSTSQKARVTVALLLDWSSLPTDVIGDRLPTDGSGRSRSVASSTATTRGDPWTERSTLVAESSRRRLGRSVVVLAKSGRGGLGAGLLGEAFLLTGHVGADVVVTGNDPGNPGVLWQLRAYRIIHLVWSAVEEDLVSVFAAWCRHNLPWAVLALGTLWGCEEAVRLAVSLYAGMVGDAVALNVTAPAAWSAGSQRSEDGSSPKRSRPQPCSSPLSDQAGGRGYRGGLATARWTSTPSKRPDAAGWISSLTAMIRP